jgi:hypothetical protein
MRLDAKLASVAAAVVLAGGCVHSKDAVAPHEPASADSAYLYGRFPLHNGTWSSVGFGMKCADGNAYVIGAYQSPGLQVIKVKPSRCAMEDAWVTSGGIPRIRFSPPPPRGQELTLSPGRAYYVGDYAAMTTSRSMGYPVYQAGRFVVVTGGLEDRYEETTAEMKTRFVQLAELETVNAIRAHAAAPDAPVKAGAGL